MYSLAARLQQWLLLAKSIVVRPYYRMRRWRPLWVFLNREPRASFVAAAKPLSSMQADIVNRLKHEGIAIAHIDDFFPPGTMLEIMQEMAQRLEQTATRNEKKNFLLQLIPLFPVLDVQNAFLRFALAEEILGCVNGYLGMWSTLYYYTVSTTLPVEVRELPRQSQCWHRDPEDRVMCKVFVYLQDVDVSAGPFIYVKESMAGGRFHGLFPQRPPQGAYPPAGAVEACVPADAIVTCTGRAGTIIFADTSGLHKGGYATAKKRVMGTAGFVTKVSERGVFYTQPENNASDVRHVLSPEAQYAIRPTKTADRRSRY
jgi:hypothetical protein